MPTRRIIHKPCSAYSKLRILWSLEPSQTPPNFDSHRHDLIERLKNQVSSEEMHNTESGTCFAQYLS